MKFKVFLAFSIALLLCARADIYVKYDTGSDSNNGTSSSPVKTIARAAQLLPSNGGTIRLANNVNHRESIKFLNTGSTGKTITILGNGSNARWFPATAYSSYFIEVIGRSKSLKIDNIEFLHHNHSGRNNAFSPILIHNSSNVTIEDCRFGRENISPLYSFSSNFIIEGDTTSNIKCQFAGKMYQ